MGETVALGLGITSFLLLLAGTISFILLHIVKTTWRPFQNSICEYGVMPHKTAKYVWVFLLSSACAAFLIVIGVGYVMNTASPAGISDASGVAGLIILSMFAVTRVCTTVFHIDIKVASNTPPDLRNIQADEENGKRIVADDKANIDGAGEMVELNSTHAKITHKDGGNAAVGEGSSNNQTHLIDDNKASITPVDVVSQDNNSSANVNPNDKKDGENTTPGESVQISEDISTTQTTVDGVKEDGSLPIQEVSQSNESSTDTTPNDVNDEANKSTDVSHQAESSSSNVTPQVDAKADTVTTTHEASLPNESSNNANTSLTDEAIDAGSASSGAAVQLHENSNTADGVAENNSNAPADVAQSGESSSTNTIPSEVKADINAPSDPAIGEDNPVKNSPAQAAESINKPQHLIKADSIKVAVIVQAGESSKPKAAPKDTKKDSNAVGDAVKVDMSNSSSPHGAKNYNWMDEKIGSTNSTLRGIIHNYFLLLSIVSIIISTLLLSYTFNNNAVYNTTQLGQKADVLVGVAWYVLGAAALMGIYYILSRLLGDHLGPFAGYFGLFERLFYFTQILWLFVAAVLLITTGMNY